jgi:Tol biopolymer transport system component
MSSDPPWRRLSNRSVRSEAIIRTLSSQFRPGLRLLLLLAVVAITITACASADVQPGVFAIYTENGTPSRIGEPVGIPVWSPIGNSLAWGSEDGLFLHSLDASQVRRLSASPVAGVPGWSPDGTKLAFVDRDRVALIVLDVGSGAEQFTQPLDHLRRNNAEFPLLAFGGPAWAPDGSQIAFVCWDGAGDEICLIRSNGTGWRQVTRLERQRTAGQTVSSQPGPAAANAGPPAWSPSGDLLAVAVYPERPGAPTGVFLVDPAEGVGRRVSSLQPNSAATWSPDGGSILFSAFRRGRSDVFRVVLADFTQRRVTEELPEGSRNPAFSPDGTRIAVETSGGIVVLGEQGTSRAFGVPGLRCAYPSWSSDGSVIAIAATSNPIASYN